MGKEKGADYYKNLKYDVMVRKADDKFTIFIPELGLIAEGESLEKAYRELESVKSRYFETMVASGLGDNIREPGKKAVCAPAAKGTFFIDIAKAAAKTIVVCLIVVMAMLFVFNHIESYITQTTQSFADSISVKKSAQTLSIMLDQINNTPDEKIEKARIKIRKASEKLKPIIDETKSLLRDETEKKI